MARRSGSRLSRIRLDVWPGFTDVITALLLIFVFVVTMFTITETILSRSLSQKDTELERLNREVSKATEDLSLKTEEIDRLRTQVGRLSELFDAETKKSQSLEETIQSLRSELESAIAQLGEKASLVAERDRLLDSRSKELEAALAQLAEKAKLLEDRDKSLEKRRADIETLVSGLKEKSELLQAKEKELGQLGLSLTESERSLAGARGELDEKTIQIARLRAQVASLNQAVATLNKKIDGYVSEINRLSRLLADAAESEAAQKTKAAALQEEIVSLKAKLDGLSARLAEAKAGSEKQFRIAQLVDLLGEKNKEIDHLRKLATYRSEFLAKLKEVFHGVPDIRVHGDRFVFQSEILFESGRASINENGKQELDKFIHIYKEMAPKIPKDIGLIILVQGYTDDVPVVASRYRSNWELASARAMEVVRYLITGGVPPNGVAAASLGEFHPVDPRDTAEARRLNRRIEIKITTL